jgi:hypothetical protein
MCYGRRSHSINAIVHDVLMCMKADDKPRAIISVRGSRNRQTLDASTPIESRGHATTANRSSRH